MTETLYLQGCNHACGVGSEGVPLGCGKWAVTLTGNYFM